MSRPFERSRERERTVVGGAERGMPVGLVEAEHERAGDPVCGHDPLERVVVADHPVDVVAEMEVRVEDVRAGRQEPLNFGVVFLDEFPGRIERASHPSNLTTTRRVAPDPPGV